MYVGVLSGNSFLALVTKNVFWLGEKKEGYLVGHVASKLQISVCISFHSVYFGQNCKFDHLG